MHGPLRHFRHLCLAALAVGLASGCRSSLAAFGESTAVARQAADELFAGFAYRFQDVHRDPKFDRARQLMGRHALVPSRLYADTSIWSIWSNADSTRTLFVRAAFDGSRYHFVADPATPYPRQVGHERHALRLKSLGRGDYEWYTTVDHAIGRVKPAAIGAVITATLTAAEGRTPNAALSDAKATFPRTTHRLSELFALDTLIATPLDDGSTDVTLRFRFRPAALRPRLPALAGYVEKYIVPSIFRARLADSQGATYFDVAGRDGRVTVRLRSRAHRLISVEGVARPLPDTLVLHADFSAKYRFFRIGFSRLKGQFIIERGEHERAWVFRFREEPQWHFPLFVERLIRNPLRRPFEGRGAEMRLGVRDDLGPQSMSVRYSRLVVNESAIMRWLGSLGASAFGDFSGETEIQENRYLHEVFSALRGDVGAWSGEGGGDGVPRSP